MIPKGPPMPEPSTDNFQYVHDKYLKDKLDALEAQLDRRITVEREFLDAYKVAQQKAEDRAERERDRSATVLKEGIQDEVRMADSNLLQHIEHQKEQVAAAFAASEKAIEKAEAAVKERLDEQNHTRTMMAQQAQDYITRQFFEQFEKETRRQDATNSDALHAMQNRVTEMEARGGGSRDQSVDARHRNSFITGLVGTAFGAIGVIVAVIVAANAAFN